MRQDIKGLLIRNAAGQVTTNLSVEPVDNQHCSTVIRAHLLEAWASVAGDPAVGVVKWLYQGAPAGLNKQSDNLDGIFPRVEDEEDPRDLHDLATDFDSFQNYSGVEDDEEALKTLEGYWNKGYLRRFDSLEQLKKHWVTNRCCRNWHALRSRSTTLTQANTSARAASSWIASAVGFQRPLVAHTQVYCPESQMRSTRRWNCWIALMMNRVLPCSLPT